MEIPKKHLGALIRAGYLIPEDPAGPGPEALLRTFIDAAQNGDEIATQVLETMPIDGMIIASLPTFTGVDVRIAQHMPDPWLPANAQKASFTLVHGRWPHDHTGSHLAHLQTLAQEGNFVARKFLAYIGKRRMLEPDFHVQER